MSYDDPGTDVLIWLWHNWKMVWFLSICLPIALLWLAFGSFWGAGTAIGNYYRSFYENM